MENSAAMGAMMMCTSLSFLYTLGGFFIGLMSRSFLGLVIYLSLYLVIGAAIMIPIYYAIFEYAGIDPATL